MSDIEIVLRHRDAAAQRLDEALLDMGAANEAWTLDDDDGALGTTTDLRVAKQKAEAVYNAISALADEIMAE